MRRCKTQIFKFKTILSFLLLTSHFENHFAGPEKFNFFRCLFSEISTTFNTYMKCIYNKAFQNFLGFQILGWSNGVTMPCIMTQEMPLKLNWFFHFYQNLWPECKVFDPNWKVFLINIEQTIRNIIVTSFWKIVW